MGMVLKMLDLAHSLGGRVMPCTLVRELYRSQRLGVYESEFKYEKLQKEFNGIGYTYEQRMEKPN